MAFVGNEDLSELIVSRMMPLEGLASSNVSQLHLNYLKAPLPKLVYTFSKPVPIPVFYKIPSTLSKKEVLQFAPFAKFIGSSHLILEASDDDLNGRIEYDMDEQDLKWIQNYNLRLNRETDTECSYDLFEFIIDRLEKEWFYLIRDIPKALQEDVHYPDDISCSVCDDGEAENSNAIVFCDGCNLAVHQDCYGVPFIPEGQWLCRKCIVSPEHPVQCVLCPTEGGAYKQTSAHKWAHLVCSMWIPECHITNTVFMEPIEGVDQIQKSRWKLVCFICQKKQGAPIQCANRNCFTAFHATCARKAKLYMRMRGQGITDSNQFRAFCDKHTPKDYREKVNVDKLLQIAKSELSQANRIERIQSPISKAKKRKASYQLISDSPNRIFSLLAPVIPQFIFKKLIAYPSELLPIHPENLIMNIAKYWSLKKKDRRGAALLKRLHLEPWTANASALKEEDEQKIRRYKALTKLRKNLERLRVLLDMVIRREKVKLKLNQSTLSIYEYAADPLSPLLRYVLESCKSYHKINFSFDKHQVFAVPVSPAIVIDYLDFIKMPMDFKTMTFKLDSQLYRSLDEFKSDISLICSNCLLYNKPDTIFAKLAIKLQTYVTPILTDLESRLSEMGIDARTGAWKSTSYFYSKLGSHLVEYSSSQIEERIE